MDSPASAIRDAINTAPILPIALEVQGLNSVLYFELRLFPETLDSFPKCQRNGTNLLGPFDESVLSLGFSSPLRCSTAFCTPLSVNGLSVLRLVLADDVLFRR